METIVLIIVGLISAGIITWKIVKASKGRGCGCGCEQTGERGCSGCCYSRINSTSNTR